MKENFQYDLLKHYDCIKSDENLLRNPTEAHLNSFFYKRTGGLHLDDFREIDKLSLEKQALLNKLNLTDLKIIKNFIFEKDAGHTGIYKPFTKFLRRETKKLRDITSADFLSFLLDFPYRPFKKYYENNKKVSEYKCPKEKVVAGETSSSILKNKPHFFPLWIWILGIVLLTIIVLGAIKNIFQPKASNIKIDNRSFDTNNYYYYYQDKGKISLLPENELTDSLKPKANPLTPVIFDQYFYSTGLDTTQMDYRLFKAQYFRNKILSKIINVDSGAKENYEVQKVTKITGSGRLRPVQQPQQASKQKENPNTPQNFTIKIINNNQQDDKIAGIIRNKLIEKYGKTGMCKGKSTYTYKKSDKYAKRKICRLEVDYQIKSDKNEVLDNKHYVLIGTGFSDETAKNNALMKLKTIIQE